MRAVVVAALVALPFSVAAAAPASADCTDVGVAEVCNTGMGSIGLDIPGLIHVCVKISNVCGS